MAIHQIPRGMVSFKAVNGYEVTPFYEVRPARSPETLRTKLDREIERLIDLANALDGDPDLEPSLAGVGAMIGDVFVDDLERDESDLDSGQPIEGGAYHV